MRNDACCVCVDVFGWYEFGDAMRDDDMCCGGTKFRSNANGMGGMKKKELGSWVL